MCVYYLLRGYIVKKVHTYMASKLSLLVQCSDSCNNVLFAIGAVTFSVGGVMQVHLLHIQANNLRNTYCYVRWEILMSEVAGFKK